MFESISALIVVIAILIVSNVTAFGVVTGKMQRRVLQHPQWQAIAGYIGERGVSAILWAWAVVAWALTVAVLFELFVGGLF